MSEYQYYEFRAIDRPLSNREMGELCAISTRATITATSFTNVYHWGDLKADPDKLLRKYFDAFLYVANWGSHRLSFRMPANAIVLDAIRAYASPEYLNVRQYGNHIVMSFHCDEDPSDEWVEGERWLSGMITLRREILGGDFRALYLGWLLRLQHQEIDDCCEEPPVPLGLGELTGPLKTLAEFLRIDDDLLTAAQASEPCPGNPAESELQWREWLALLDQAEKDELLYRTARDQSNVTFELRTRFRQHLAAMQPTLARDAEPRRTVADILALRNEITEKRRQQLAKKREQQASRKAASRKKYLHDLATREEVVQNEVEKLIQTRQPKNYGQAVQLLNDLSDSAKLQGQDSFADYLLSVRYKHARKTRLMQRLNLAGL